MKTMRFRLSNGIFVLLGLGLLICPGLVFAECKREDVTFYLKNGFTQEQVVSLCASSASPSQTKSAATQNNIKVTPEPVVKIKQPVKNTSNGSTIGQDALLYLKIAISADDVRVRDDALQYTRRECIEYGEMSNDEGIQGSSLDEACAFVSTFINLKGLQVKRFTSTLSILSGGGDYAVVTGDFKKEILDTSPIPVNDRSLVISELAELAESKKLKIPIRKDVSFKRFKYILESLAQ